MAFTTTQYSMKAWRRGRWEFEGDLLDAQAVIPFSYSFTLKSDQQQAEYLASIDLLLLECYLFICYQAGHEGFF